MCVVGIFAMSDGGGSWLVKEGVSALLLPLFVALFVILLVLPKI